MNLQTLIHRNIFTKSIPIYYGIGINHLDIETMQYKMFAAVWKQKNGYRYIIGYWFSDNKEYLMAEINSQKWTNLLRVDEQISEVYEIIREEQEKIIWNTRIKLTNSLENWIGKQPGWYVIKSSKNFPCTITCVQKTRHTVWIEHVGICENQNDMKRLINILNLEHNIHLM